MPVYVDIGAARIQSWLLRTPELTLMRGASRVLQDVTASDAILQLNLPGAERVAGAPDISGVVSLEFSTMDVAEAALPRLLLHLQEQIPGLEWEGWCLEHSDYFRARAAVRRGDDHRRVTVLPSVQDFGAIHACDCRREPARPYAARPGDDPETLKRKRHGADCHARHRAQRDERRIDEEGMGIVAEIPGALPKDFDQLARKGGLAKGAEVPKAHGRKESRNHLATIVADGNAVGGLFDAIGAASNDGIEGLDAARSALVTALDETIESAVFAAAVAVSDPDAEVKVVTAHYLGGDDIFLSVPAVHAWRYCAVLASEFTKGLSAAKGLVDALNVPSEASEEATTRLDTIKTKMGQASLGIGICFAHASHPISETHHAAEEAMKQAKKSAHGASSAMGWTDLTAGPVEGGLVHSGVIGTEVVQRELALHPNGDSPTLPDVFDLGPSARARLATILRDNPDSPEAVDVWAKRVNWRRDKEGRKRTAYDQLAVTLLRARWAPQAAQDDEGTKDDRR
jgi:hypothetical protein